MRVGCIVIGGVIILFGCLAIRTSFLVGVDIASVVSGLVRVAVGVLIIKVSGGKDNSQIWENEEINIPNDIEKYLVEDEKVDKKYDLKDDTVFTSINRMFIKKGNTVRDISYAQISSIELKARIRWLTIIIGILLIAINYDLQNTLHFLAASPNSPEYRLIDSGYGWLVWIIFNIPGILGFIFVIMGFSRKIHRISFSVVGITKGQVLSGNRDTLDSLLRLVSERRVQPISITSDEKTTHNP